MVSLGVRKNPRRHLQYFRSAFEMLFIGHFVHLVFPRFSLKEPNGHSVNEKRYFRETAKKQTKVKTKRKEKKNNKQSRKRQKKRRELPRHLATSLSHPGLQRQASFALSARIHFPFFPQMASDPWDVSFELSTHLPEALAISDSFVGATVCGRINRLSGKTFSGQTLYVTIKEFKVIRAPLSWMARITRDVLSLIGSDNLATSQGMADMFEIFPDGETVCVLLKFPFFWSQFEP